MRKITPVLLAFSLVFSLCLADAWPGESSGSRGIGGSVSAAPVKSGVVAVDGGELYSWCKYLSGPRFEGRLLGSEGFTAAARWAAGKFREFGLKPAYPEGGFLQAFPIAYTVVETAEMSLLLPNKTGNSSAANGGTPLSEKALQIRRDFLPYFFSGSGERETEAVFAGWGISAPDAGYDDYAGLDVKGKFVFCFQGSPDPGNPALVPFDRHLVRQKTAREKGAAGIFYVQTGIVGSPNGEWSADFLPGVISTAVADDLFAERGITAAKVLEAMKAFRRPLSFPLKARIRYSVRANHVATATGYNVVGYVPGADPALRGEYLIIGGHIDHLGRHLGSTYPGANDNASGSAVVLGLAKALAARPDRPTRSILFVLFGGEEMSLAGSHFFLDHPPSGLKKFDAMFNFDMNGVGNGMVCYISPASPELGAVLSRADEPGKLLRELHDVKVTTPSGSDFAIFGLKGIPFISFFSNNFEAKYHVPEDTYYQVNPDIMADIAGVAGRAALLWASR